MARYRVVQWATGNVGLRALRAVLDRDMFDLVGVHAFSPDKVGQDAGTLAGIARVGVLATDDIDALIGEAPDCVIYTPRVIDYALVCRMLRAGINVVTTGDFLTGTHHLPEWAALTAAAQQGGATFLGTGFEPGFVNVAAGFLSSACRRVYSVKLVETLDCTQYPVRQAWTVLGFAKPAKDRLVEIDPPPHSTASDISRRWTLSPTCSASSWSRSRVWSNKPWLHATWIWVGSGSPRARWPDNVALIAATAMDESSLNWRSAGP